MSKTIEADFLLPAIDAIQDASRTLVVDNNHEAANPAEPLLNKASRSPTFEASDTKASSKRAEF